MVPEGISNDGFLSKFDLRGGGRPGIKDCDLASLRFSVIKFWHIIEWKEDLLYWIFLLKIMLLPIFYK